tara:strand:+ start:1207 stop:1506 length:300 start_codon:yes stop_codon:yes gene_type:complete
MGLFGSKEEDERLITIIKSLENRIAILEGTEPPHKPVKKLNRNVQRSIKNFKFKQKSKTRIVPIVKANNKPTLFDELHNAIVKRRDAIMDKDELYRSDT